MNKEFFNEKFAGKDPDGNRVRVNGRCELLLHLKGEGKTRNIGRLESVGGRIRYSKYCDPTNMFQANMSWGISWVVLDKLADNDDVVFYTDRTKYYITAGEARECGSFLNFKKQGFELQLFVPIERWKRL